MIRKPIALSLLFATVHLSATGCSSNARLPTAPAPADAERAAASALPMPRDPVGAREFYPLVLGNRWVYEGWSFTSEAPQVGDPVTKRGAWTREARLSRVEVLGGREIHREEGLRQDETLAVRTVRWLTQDRSGLFELGVPPPSRDSASSGFMVRLLAYPLHARSVWVVDDVRRITARVEARELIETPAGRFPAWRIRLRHGGRLPQEEVFVWYGDVGYLGMRSHLQFERPDGRGGRIVITHHDEEWLTAASFRVAQERTLDGAAR